MFISAWTFFGLSLLTVTQTADAQDVEIAVSGKKKKKHAKQAGNNHRGTLE